MKHETDSLNECQIAVHSVAIIKLYRQSDPVMGGDGQDIRTAQSRLNVRPGLA
jgi:hypothetical protein